MKKHITDFLFKLGSYTILLFVSSSVAALPILYSIDDPQKKSLSLELIDISLSGNSAQSTADVMRNSQQAKQAIELLEKNFREHGDLSNTLALAPHIEELLPADLKIKYLHVIALVAAGDAASARQLLRQSKVKSNQASAYASMAQAAVSKVDGKLNDAKAAANRAISIDDKHPYPYNILGQIEAARQNYAAATKNLQTAVRISPNFSVGWSNLGVAQLVQGKLESAERSFSTAIKLTPDYCVPLIGRAKILVGSGYIKKAITDLETCVNTQPEYLQAKKLLVALYLQDSRLDDAEKIALSLKTKDPVLSNTILADIYLRQNQPAKARKQLQQIDSRYAQNYYLLSYCDMLEGKNKDALKHIKQGEKQRPDAVTLKIARLIFSFYADQPVDQTSLKKIANDAAVGHLALFLAGNVQAASGNMKHAYQFWKQAEGLLPGFSFDGISLKIISKSVTAREQRYLALGMLYYQQNFYAASLSEFKKALDTNPQSFLTNYFVAITSSYSSNKSDIITHLKRSLKQAPDFVAANYMLAEIYMQDKDIDSAINHYQAAADNTVDTGLLIKLGMLYERQGRKNDAVTVYRNLIDKHADNFIAYNLLAWMYARDGENLDEALQLAKKADELQPGNISIIDTIGWIYFQNNNYPKAKKYLSQANEVSKGKNADVLFHLASLEYALGDMATARALVEKALNTSKNFESAAQAKELLGKL